MRKTTQYKREKRQRQVRDIAYIIICTMILLSISYHLSSKPVRVTPPIAQAQAQVAVNVKETQAWLKFIEAARQLSPIYNFPLKLLLSQAALESAHGTSYFATTRYNYFGMGAFDYDPNQAYTYENAQQGIIDYMYNIKNTFPDAWASRDNPEQMLQLLENNSQGLMYATDPSYINKVESEPEWSTE